MDFIYLGLVIAFGWLTVLFINGCYKLGDKS